MLLIFQFTVLILLVGLFGTEVTAVDPKLEKYNVDVNAITVSGISSGSCFAMQVHFALSSTIKGSGLFEGGPYACAYNGTLEDSLNCQIFPERVNVQTLIQKTDALAANGEIDPTSNLEAAKIYIFHGINDQTVPQKSSFNVLTQCRHYKANVLTKFNSECNHGQPVDGNGFGGPCDQINSNFINECAYNGAYEMFNWLYGAPGQSLIRPERGFVADGNIIHFDQNEFVNYTTATRWMADSGFLYLPKNCAGGAIKCKLHVAFHGCSSNEEHFGTRYATTTQYAEVAEVNNIIVLFPQTANVPLLNPSGCWDCFGPTGLYTYPTKSGLEISAVQKMIERVTS